MLQKHRHLASITSLVLFGAYSAVMMATSGTAAWAWAILAAAIVLLVMSARSGRAGEAEGHDG